MDKRILHITTQPFASENSTLVNGCKLCHSIDTTLLNPNILKEIQYKKRLFLNLKDCKELSEIVGRLCGYDFLFTNDNVGGYCDIVNKEIAFNPFYLEYANKMAIIFHEIAHAIQADLGYFDKAQNLLTSQLYLEQQAETIAFYLHNECLGFADKTLFKSYFSKEDWDWLANYYKGFIENDLE